MNNYKPKKLISLRLTSDLVNYIDYVLPHTEFFNRTQFIQYACDQYCFQLADILVADEIKTESA